LDPLPEIQRADPETPDSEVRLLKATVPFTDSVRHGDEVAIPTLPTAETIREVVVARPAVEEATIN
jgi:hypothetical protein